MKGRVERFGKGAKEDGDEDEVDETTERMQNGQKRRIQRLEKKLEWTEHKAPPIPITKGSTIISDCMYLYGVYYLSTKDVAQYFSRFTDEKSTVNGLEKLKIIWINDSSCVVKF